MTITSIDANRLQAEVRTLGLTAGFSRVRFISPYGPSTDVSVHGGIVPPNYQEGSPALMVVALPYGDGESQQAPPKKVDKALLGPENTGATPSVRVGRIAPFARKNYYAEAVRRLQKIAQTLRNRYGGIKADYRILCNSPVPEKPLAELCGLGVRGKNDLIITPEAGSRVIIAALSLPFTVPQDPRLPWNPCAACIKAAETKGSPLPCFAACPTQAFRNDGTLIRERCIQWYASGNGESVPLPVADRWGQRLYGCTNCQDVCPHNSKKRESVTDLGLLPEVMDLENLLRMNDSELTQFFKGTAMGLSWLGPSAIRRNARLALRSYS